MKITPYRDFYRVELDAIIQFEEWKVIKQWGADAGIEYLVDYFPSSAGFVDFINHDDALLFYLSQS